MRKSRTRMSSADLENKITALKKELGITQTSQPLMARNRTKITGMVSYKDLTSVLKRGLKNN